MGLVVSQGKMAKTAKVRVQWKTYNKTVHKEILKRRDYLVHDEGDLCREGDVVRIEAIPRRSARKTFAVAEIKVNKGLQFALYETLAKEKLQQEEKDSVEALAARRDEFSRTITQIQDLQRLDEVVNQYQTNPNADREALVTEIRQIQDKYGIQAWPLPEPILQLALDKPLHEISEADRRQAHFPEIYRQISQPQHAQWRHEVLSRMAKREPAALASHTAKNMLRKHILDVKNACPVPIPP